MRLSLCFLCFLLGFCVEAKLVIDLYRQPTPREAIHNAPNIPDHGIWLDWLKRPYSEYRTNDTIPLLRFLDTEFYAKIFAGSPGQPIDLIFDTAWSDTWLISKDCGTLKPGCWFHQKYDHRHSSSYTSNGAPFIANEGTYNLTGYYSSDKLKFAHTTVNQTFVEMTNVPYWYIFTKADGVVGLGLPRNNVKTFFGNILTQTNITNPIFSIYLNRDRSSNKGGSIILGEIDKKHIHVTNKKPDPITYVPINANSAQWEFAMDRVFLTVTNKTYEICGSDCVGFADTSTTSIITSQDSLKKINELINAKQFAFGRYEIECDTVKKLPFISFVIGGKNFNLTGTDYTQKVSYGPFSLCISAFTASTSPAEQNRWLMGAAFLSKFYTIYDVGNKQIGIVRAASV